MVYFIQCGNKNGHIKIGWTIRNPKYRMRQIQVKANGPLKLLGIIECKSGIEHAIHDMFEKYAVGNEWFEPAAEIFEFIKDNAMTYDEYRIAAIERYKRLKFH